MSCGYDERVLRARAQSIGGASQIKAGHARVADALELARELDEGVDDDTRAKRIVECGPAPDIR